MKKYVYAVIVTAVLFCTYIFYTMLPIQEHTGKPAFVKNGVSADVCYYDYRRWINGPALLGEAEVDIWCGVKSSGEYRWARTAVPRPFNQAHLLQAEYNTVRDAYNNQRWLLDRTWR